MKVPKGYRNYSVDERLSFLSKFTLPELIDIAKETLDEEIVGKSFYKTHPRLEDIRTFLDNLYGMYYAAKECKGDDPEAKKIFKYMDFWVTDILLSYAEILRLQGDWKSCQRVVEEVSQRNDLTQDKIEIIKDLRNWISKEKSLKRRYIKASEELYAWKKQHEGCFIATAAYGTPFAYEIDVLRKWRDDSLSESMWGRVFIRAYYKISPPIAKCVSKSNALKIVIRKLLRPIINMLKRKYKTVTPIEGGGIK